jgi:hypothetical protein
MAVILNASTSTGFVQTADTSGIVQVQSNGTTKLTVDSTGVTATSIQGTIVQGTAVASTSGTSIDFTGIPSWVKRITVLFDDVSTSGTSNMLVQLGDSGGIETTGYLSTGALYQGGVTVTSSTAGFLINNNIAANTLAGAMQIFTLDSGTSWVASGVFSSSGTAQTQLTGGSKATSATLDRVRITTVNGTDTFDAGSINILYEG